MSKINRSLLTDCTSSRAPKPGEIDENMTREHERNILRSIITERLKRETKLFINLALCESQLKSFEDEFTLNCLSGHTMMEWSDRVEKLKRAKAMLLELIELRTNEIIDGKHDIK